MHRLHHAGRHRPHSERFFTRGTHPVPRRVDRAVLNLSGVPFTSRSRLSSERRFFAIDDSPAAAHPWLTIPPARATKISYARGSPSDKREHCRRGVDFVADL